VVLINENRTFAVNGIGLGEVAEPEAK